MDCLVLNYLLRTTILALMIVARIRTHEIICLCLFRLASVSILANTQGEPCARENCNCFSKASEIPNTNLHANSKLSKIG